MAYTNIALTKFISQEKNDALPNSQGLNLVGYGPLKANSSGVISAITPTNTNQVFMSGSTTGTTEDPVWRSFPIYSAVTAIAATLNPSITITGLTDMTTFAIVTATMTYLSSPPPSAADILPCAWQLVDDTSIKIFVNGTPGTGAYISWAVLKKG
jgi:hypothetical protein